LMNTYILLILILLFLFPVSWSFGKLAFHHPDIALVVALIVFTLTNYVILYRL